MTAPPMSRTASRPTSPSAPCQPPSPRCSEVFDLDADPQTLPRDVLIYLSALCGPHSSEDEDEHVARGLRFLKERRAQGRGIFFDAFSPEQRARRSVYPFLPPGLPVQQMAAMLPNPNAPPSVEPKGPYGEPMICKTNVRLPIPPEFSNARTDLFETLVVWLYSLHTPFDTAMTAPRYEEDSEGYDWERPIDVDAEFTDTVLMQRLVDEVRGQVSSYQRNHTFLPSAYAWAATPGPLL